MKPLDPRLVRYATSARPALAGVVALGVAQGGLIVAQALVVADVVVRAIDGAPLRQLVGGLLALAALALARGAAVWLTDALGARAALRVTTQLRATALQRALALGPAWLSGERRGALTALLTRGIGALEPYVGRYLPALALAALVPPLALAAIAVHDPWSAAIIVATLPLVPIFGALVGWATERRAARQWRSMAALAGHFADVTAGLPTLVAHRRAAAQTRRIAELTRAHARSSLSTLRLAFASSAVLELVATISVALVAVSVGLRLLGSAMDFRPALVVLLLAPEVYWPLRRVGAQFHAAAEGVGVVDDLVRILETPEPARGARRDVPDLRTTPIRLRDAVVRYPGRTATALGPISLDLEPGRVHAITGESGAGKSTLLSLLLGFAPLDGGSVELGDRALSEFDPEAVRAQIAWLPQSPDPVRTGVGDYLRGLRPAATDEQIQSALDAVGLADVVRALPRGLNTMLDAETGPSAGLSAGERARLGLARVILAQRPLILLDEPSARLDAATEQIVGQTIRRLSGTATVLLVTHRESTAGLAEARIDLAAAPAPTRDLARA